MNTVAFKYHNQRYGRMRLVVIDDRDNEVRCRYAKGLLKMWENI